MQNKHYDDKLENSRPESKKSQSIDRESTSHKSFSSIPSELKRAEISIQNLLHDKESLKHSLSKASKKKDELFKVLLEYKEAVERLKTKNFELESRANQVDMVRSEIEKIKHQLARRDEKIEFLITRNQELESLVSELTQNPSKHFNSSKSSKPLSNSSIQLFETNLKLMLQKIKNFPNFHRLFKNCVPCINSFIEFIEKSQLDQALNSVSKFANELMKEYERLIARDLSPGLSEIQSSAPVSNNATINYNYYHFDEENNDLDRIERLHLELKEAVARSKEVLFNRSVSSSQLIVENSAFASKSRTDSKKSVRMDESRLKEPGSMNTKIYKTAVSRIPTVESKGKNGKYLIKSSILKRNE